MSKEARDDICYMSGDAIDYISQQDHSCLLSRGLQAAWAIWPAKLCTPKTVFKLWLARLSRCLRHPRATIVQGFFLSRVAMRMFTSLGAMPRNKGGKIFFDTGLN